MNLPKIFKATFFVLAASILVAACTHTEVPEVPQPDQSQTIDQQDGTTGLGELFDSNGNPVFPEASPTSAAESQAVNEQLIVQALAKKNNWDPSTITARIMQQSGPHFAGSIGFSDSPGGGLFYAVKQNEEMIIVFDGNGAPTCAVADGNNFPASMIPECYDTEKETLMRR